MINIAKSYSDKINLIINQNPIQLPFNFEGNWTITLEPVIVQEESTHPCSDIRTTGKESFDKERRKQYGIQDVHSDSS